MLAIRRAPSIFGPNDIEAETFWKSLSRNPQTEAQPFEIGIR